MEKLCCNKHKIRLGEKGKSITAKLIMHRTNGRKRTPITEGFSSKCKPPRMQPQNKFTANYL